MFYYVIYALYSLLLLSEKVNILIHTIQRAIFYHVQRSFLMNDHLFSISSMEGFMFMLIHRYFFYFLITLSILVLGLPVSFAAEAVSGSFTDSQGRTTLYRYSLKDEWDTNIPRGLLIYFHGNNSISQTEILDMFFRSTEQNAYERNLIPVVVSSPETRSDGVTRQWKDGDKLMIKELIDGEFKGAFSIDSNRIIFSGASQGTCFLHDFIMAYGENYGGGFYGGCGCYNSPDPLWNPDAEFKSRFKVFVHATTEDFLHTSSLSGYNYYRYTVGMNTRSDLKREGSHCSASSIVENTAYDWILGVNEIPPEPVVKHWQRVSTIDNIVGLVSGANNQLWAAQQSQQNQVKIWLSKNNGVNWTLLSQLDGEGQAFFILQDNLLLQLDNQLYRSTDGGNNFSALTANNSIRAPFSTDGNARIFSSNPLHYSDDFGESWQLVFKDDNVLYLTEASPQALIVRQIENGQLSDGSYISFDSTNTWQQLNNTPIGKPHSIAWDGTTLWALSSAQNVEGYSLYQSANQGMTWTSVTLPQVTQNYSNAQMSSIDIINGSELVIYGAWNTSWLSSDRGQTWEAIVGVESLLRAKLTLSENLQQAYLTAGSGIFFLDDENNNIPPTPQPEPKPESIQDWQRVLNWAETLYPELFPAKDKQEHTFSPYLVRYYPATDTYLGYNPEDTHFYGYNVRIWGKNIVRFDTLAAYLAIIE